MHACTHTLIEYVPCFLPAASPVGDLNHKGCFHIYFATVDDGAVGEWAVVTISCLKFYGVDHCHAIDDFSKYHMFAVQPGGLGQGDEELRAIGIRPGIGHADPSNAIMLQFEVLIWKCLTVNAYTASAIPIGEVSSLNHEIFDDTMKFASFISISFLPCGQSNKIVHRLGHNFSKEANHYPANIFVSDPHIKENLGRHRGASLADPRGPRGPRRKHKHAKPQAKPQGRQQPGT